MFFFQFSYFTIEQKNNILIDCLNLLASIPIWTGTMVSCWEIKYTNVLFKKILFVNILFFYV